MNDGNLRRELLLNSGVFGEISVDQLGKEARGLWQSSDEEEMRPMDGSGLTAAGTGASVPTMRPPRSAVSRSI
ncbi:hypothetical protein [Paracoccus cavernae]|uniref:hypothetical protein n=1 Tax=Paracoccus cavernae TaxID=1571207 RepID=UPI003635B328